MKIPEEDPATRHTYLEVLKQDIERGYRYFWAKRGVNVDDCKNPEIAKKKFLHGWKNREK